MPWWPLDVLMGLAAPLTWGLGVVFTHGAIENLPPTLVIQIEASFPVLIPVCSVPGQIQRSARRLLEIVQAELGQPLVQILAV